MKPADIYGSPAGRIVEDNNFVLAVEIEIEHLVDRLPITPSSSSVAKQLPLRIAAERREQDDEPGIERRRRIELPKWNHKKEALRRAA